MDAQELQTLKNRYDIIGNDPALNRALETAVAIAPTDLTVLIEGESGTGKENIPQIIHQHSRRRTGRYLAVNCGAIPEGTINAELFGHEKGAFTGAVGERKGYFEEANGGTIFLDEIGELPKETQAMLLRVLQNGEYMKVGSSKVEKTDVRVICATNVNLSYAVAAGKFRQRSTAAAASPSTLTPSRASRRIAGPATYASSRAWWAVSPSWSPTAWFRPRYWPVICLPKAPRRCPSVRETPAPTT